jgi:DNA-binding NarL/FixJ family response regulator
MTPPRVVLADDSALFREGLATLLPVAGIEVVAQTSDAEAIEQLVGTHRPDVLVTDVRMPPRQVDEGIQAARLVRRRHPGVGVVILSQHVDVVHALDILADRQGGVAYLLKDHVANIDELRDAIERVMARDFVFDRDVVAELVQQRRLSGVVAGLSPREREVLALMAEGRTNAAIARKLWVTPGAVEKHVRSIFRKLDLPDTPDDHRRVLAVMRYLAPSPLLGADARE